MKAKAKPRTGKQQASKEPARGNDAPVKAHLPVAASGGWLNAAVPVYVLIILGGYLFFHSGLATVRGNELSRYRALFAAVRAATLTGFQEKMQVNEYTTAGKVVTFLLMGLGISFSLIVGGTAVKRIAGVNCTDGKIVAWALGAIAIVMVIGAILGRCAGLTGGDGVFQSVSAFGNCGLFTGTLPGGDGVWANLVLMPLAIIGGLGVVVWMELLGRRGISRHSWVSLLWSGKLYLVGFGLLIAAQLMAQWPGFGGSSDVWRHVFGRASLQAINARSAGFPFEMGTFWPRTMQWVVMLLMLIGASAGGTGGGLRVNALAALSEGGGELMHGRTVAGKTLGIVQMWVAIYLGVLAAGFMILLCTEPDMGADRVLFLAISAIGNVGLSHDPVTVSDWGLYMLCGMMMIGRVAPVMILWWMVESGAVGGG